MLAGAELADLLRCPLCGSAVAFRASALSCTHPDCRHAAGFPVLAGQPVLLTDDGIATFDTARLLTEAAPARRKQLRSTPVRKFYKALSGSNAVAPENAAAFLDLCLARKQSPRILIVGGGTRGQGADAVWSNPDIRRVAFDIYASENTDFVADAHRIPLEDGAIDGVWIQAVLEHVVDPWQVVAEIWRVLGTDGVVYAETPFMQQVHEGAYDFFRFSHSGHRWLFRRFREVKSGAVAGAGVGAIWALRYLARAMTGSDAAAGLVGLGFAWLKVFDRIGSRRRHLDAASGVFFLGHKSCEAMQAADLVRYYRLS